MIGDLVALLFVAPAPCKRIFSISVPPFRPVRSLLIALGATFLFVRTVLRMGISMEEKKKEEYYKGKEVKGTLEKKKEYYKGKEVKGEK